MLRGVENLLITKRGEQIDNLGTSGYLYKGLEIGGFPSYFSQGGIRPSYADMTSITDNWIEAEDYGNISTPGRGRECLAVIRRDGVQGKLIESTDMGYKGDYFVPWDALERLFVSDTMLVGVRKAYDSVQDVKIPWTEFISKVTVIKPTQLSFRNEFAHFLRRIR